MGDDALLQPLGDAASESGPRDPLVSPLKTAEDTATPAIAPAHESPFGWDPPGKCVCDLCGGAYMVNNWADYSRFCPEHEYMSKQFMLQAKIDAHGVFVKGGCDMYGSQAHPDLDKGWLDGYAAGRYDSRIERWKEERERVSDRSGRDEGAGPTKEDDTHAERGPKGDAQQTEPLTNT